MDCLVRLRRDVLLCAFGSLGEGGVREKADGGGEEEEDEEGDCVTLRSIEVHKWKAVDRYRDTYLRTGSGFAFRLRANAAKRSLANSRICQRDGIGDS